MQLNLNSLGKGTRKKKRYVQTGGSQEILGLDKYNVNIHRQKNPKAPTDSISVKSSDSL
jgi:hypothetical protein